MKRAVGALLTVGVLAGGGLTERIIDPFDRHEVDFRLEGPSNPHSEVFYMSSNWYDENGNKRDDRTGDAYLGVILITATGAIALGLRQTEHGETLAQTER